MIMANLYTKQWLRNCRIINITCSLQLKYMSPYDNNYKGYIHPSLMHEHSERMQLSYVAHNYAYISKDMTL